MNYNELIASSNVVLVEFFATWCPHCQRMMPIVEEVKEALNGKAEVYQLDIDKYEELAESEGADTVPTFIVYKDGKEVFRQSGEMPRDVLLKKVEEYL